MNRGLYPVLLLSIVLAPSGALAGAADVDPALREQARAMCMNDAMRLCGDAISDEGAMLACMRPKRSELTAPCRKVFDKVVQAVRR